MRGREISEEKKMKLRRKQKLTAIALTISMIFSVLVTTSIATAHTPPWSVNTFAYCSVAPNPTGVGQEVLIMAWLHVVPPTAEGAYGDRWKGYKITITRPDNTTETKGPITSDPVGSSWAFYTPTQVGEYKFQMTFPGQTLAGENRRPGSTQGAEYIGDYFEPSTSNVATLTVQQDPIPPYEDTPLPTGYWTRPISGEHREWWQIAANWVSPPASRYALVYAPFTKAPDTSHILWSEPLTIGGVVGGELGSTAYHDGGAYEGKWSPVVIINGVLYYNKYPANYHIQGVIARDLRTGETVWNKDGFRINFGQIFRYDSPNQHGAFAYLWSVSGSNWTAYDAFSGEKWYTIYNVPSGTRVYAQDGSILIYQLNTQGDWLAMWNSSAMPALLEGPTGSSAWSLRPYGKTINGTTGYSWNVTTPSDVTGSITWVLQDRVLISNGFGQLSRVYLPTNGTIWALNLNPSLRGQLMWQRNYNATEGETLELASVSLEDKVFTLKSFQTRSHWGYSLDTGEQIWGPTPSQDVWDMFLHEQTGIAYHKLYSVGYSGIVYAYDILTGELEWTYEADDPTWEALHGGNYPLYFAGAADGKIYVMASEHSPDNPKPRGSRMWALNAETGEELWTIPFYWPSWSDQGPAIADGILLGFSTLDNVIYAFGKGQTETTVQAPLASLTQGQSTTIIGTITDQSPGAKDTPAIADESMDDWMRYLYMQFPAPTNATGVKVKLTTINPNGETVDIGTATSDVAGNFGIMWTPSTVGLYQITATFEGTLSYYSSFATTYMSVSAAPSPSATATPLPTTTPPTATPTPSPSPTTAPQPKEAPLDATYIVAAAVVIIALVAIAAVMLRRRK